MRKHVTAILREQIVTILARLFVIYFVLAALSASAEIFPVELSPDAPSINLSSATWLLEDPEGNLTLDDVRSPEYASRFQPRSSVLGYTTSAYWIRVTLRNLVRRDDTWWFDSKDRHLREIDFYAPDSGGIYRRQSTSSMKPFAQRPVPAPNFVFPVTLPAERTIDIYLRIRSTGYLQVSIYPILWQPAAFQLRQEHNRMSWFFYLGMAAALGMFNLLLFFVIRDRVYLYYVISVAASAILVDCISPAQGAYGFLQSDLWANSPTFNLLTVFGSAYLGSLANTIFAVTYVDLHAFAPKVYRAVKWYFVVFGLITGIVFLRALPEPAVSAQVAAIFQNLFVVVIAILPLAWVTVLIKPAISGNLRVRLLLIAWAPYYASAFIASAQRVLHSYIDWVFPPIMLGSGIEMVLMSIALGARFNQERREKAHAQAALIEGLRQSERELEGKVEQRTAEVKAQAAQLDEWNHTLEQRVQEQVDQIERLGRLKRFFSPQLAEVIVAEGEDALKTHRREISVVFIDLRGFSAFTDRAEPEEVIEMLHAFHGMMGRIIMDHGGTLERFAGDSIMIFFNDPVPIANHAEKAVRMALAMQEAFRQLSAEWRQRSYELGLGCGIALGYATLGEIGFEGRWDYAAIGGVTNLAARLCAEAGSGQVLVDRKVMGEVESLVHAASVGPLALKGFAQAVPAFSLTGLDTAT